MELRALEVAVAVVNNRKLLKRKLGGIFHFTNDKVTVKTNQNSKRSECRGDNELQTKLNNEDTRVG